MNIAVLGSKSLPAFAGADRVAENILHHLPTDDGNRYQIYVVRTPAQPRAFDVAPNLRVIPIPALSGKHSRATSFFLLSALHCIGMCGGIMAALTMALPESTRTQPARLLGFLAAYNLGRILSYTLAGALAGSLGLTLVEGSGSVELGLVLRAVAALLMVFAGLHLAGWLPAVGRLERLGAPLWRRLEPVARRLVPVRTAARAALYGAVWGWLPCGLVYAMLGVAAGQATVAGGAATMAAFGAGTLPTLVITGLFATRVYRLRNRPLLQQAGGLAVALVGGATLIYLLLGDFWIVPDLEKRGMP